MRAVGQVEQLHAFEHSKTQYLAAHVSGNDRLTLEEKSH